MPWCALSTKTTHSQTGTESQHSFERGHRPCLKRETIAQHTVVTLSETKSNKMGAIEMNQTKAWPPLAPGISASSGSIHDREAIRRNAQAPTTLAARYQTVRTIERRFCSDEFIVPSPWQTQPLRGTGLVSMPMVDDASGEEMSVSGRRLTLAACHPIDLRATSARRQSRRSTLELSRRAPVRSERVATW